jgi:hypothetical protein
MVPINIMRRKIGFVITGTRLSDAVLMDVSTEFIIRTVPNSARCFGRISYEDTSVGLKTS